MSLNNIRVVITGASSGIGAATAIAFAREGARLVLGARGQDGLDDVARRCRAAGATVDTGSIDVTDADAVKTFAADARDALGGIDLWFSDVGIGVVGKYHEVPLADHQRVIESNLISHMNEAHAVLPVFLKQGHGTWVNMISAGGFVAAPYAAAYSASKFALRGFSESLRGELAGHPDIHVCDVYPTFVDTPGFAHAGNYTGAQLKYPPGAIAPEKVAQAVVKLAQRPRATTAVGAPALALQLAQFLPLSGAMNHFLDKWSQRGDRTPQTRGSLYAPPRGASGLHSGQRRAGSGAGPDAGSQPSTALVVGAAAIGLALGLQLWKRKS